MSYKNYVVSTTLYGSTPLTALRAVTFVRLLSGTTNKQLNTVCLLTRLQGSNVTSCQKAKFYLLV